MTDNSQSSERKFAEWQTKVQRHYPLDIYMSYEIIQPIKELRFKFRKLNFITDIYHCERTIHSGLIE